MNVISQSDKEFTPLVATYAISGGTEYPEKRLWKFTYFMFAINNGFTDAMAQASPPIQQLAAVNAKEGIQPMPAVMTRFTDADDNLIKVELRHPNYSPFGSNAPLMFIEVQNLDTEIEETRVLEIPFPTEVESGKSEGNSSNSPDGEPASSGV